MSRAAVNRRVRAILRAARRSRFVRERWAFVRREAAKRPVIGTYRLAGRGGGTVFLRHDGLDAWTLEEIFGFQVYALPEPVRRRFAGVGNAKVLDLGANIGLASLFLSAQLDACTGIAFEPDPNSAELLERCLAANSLHRRWEVVRAAASNRDGEVRFLAGRSAVSHITTDDDESAIEVPARDVLEALSSADLAKLDIEGAEWPILTDPRFGSNGPTALVVEYHADGCPSGDPRGAILALLGAAGYHTHEAHFPESANMPADQGVVWGWRDP